MANKKRRKVVRGRAGSNPTEFYIISAASLKALASVAYPDKDHSAQYLWLDSCTTHKQVRLWAIGKPGMVMQRYPIHCEKPIEPIAYLPSAIRAIHKDSAVVIARDGITFDGRPVPKAEQAGRAPNVDLVIPPKIPEITISSLVRMDPAIVHRYCKVLAVLITPEETGVIRARWQFPSDARGGIRIDIVNNRLLAVIMPYEDCVTWHI